MTNLDEHEHQALVGEALGRLTYDADRQLPTAPKSGRRREWPITERKIRLVRAVL
jgi:Ser/Thr protein kinase RdoA (MazF antagonist)